MSLDRQMFPVDTPFGQFQIMFLGPEKLRIGTVDGMTVKVFNIQYEGSLYLQLDGGEWCHPQVHFYRPVSRDDCTHAATEKIKSVLIPIAAKWASDNPMEQANEGVRTTEGQIARAHAELTDIDKQREAKVREIADLEAQRKAWQSKLVGEEEGGGTRG